MMYAIIVNRDAGVSEKVIQRLKRIHSSDTEQALIIKTDKDLGRDVQVLHMDMMIYQAVRELERMLGHGISIPFEKESKKERDIIEKGQARVR